MAEVGLGRVITRWRGYDGPGTDQTGCDVAGFANSVWEHPG